VGATRFQDYCTRVAGLNFRIAHKTGIRFFHWFGNHWLFVWSQGRFPNRKNPDMVDLGFFNKHDQKGIGYGPFVDKELVKHFVSGMTPQVRLPETYDILKTEKELRAFELDKPYVAKPTHSSGTVAIKPEGGKLTEKEISDLLYRLGHNYYTGGGEIQYRFLEKKIIVEEFIGEGEKAAPDMKFQCHNGRMHHCFVMLDRFGSPKPMNIDRHGKRIPFDFSCRLYTMGIEPYNGPYEVPDIYPRMVEAAETLSAPFEYVRVDMLLLGEEMLFGELTFTPANCLIKFHSRELTDLSWKPADDAAGVPTA